MNITCVIIIIIIILCVIFYFCFTKSIDNYKNLLDSFDTYYINLARRDDKNKKTLLEINKSKILKNKIKRFNAIDGNNLDLTKYISNDLNLEILKKRKGWIGCALSHIELWKKCVNIPFLIMEDDDIIRENFDENLIKIFNNTPEDYDIIYLITDNDVKYKPYNDLFVKVISSNFLMSGYIISPKGAKILLDNITPYIPTYQIDTKIVGLTYRNLLQCYIYKQNIIYNIQDFTHSDIQFKLNIVKKFDKSF